MPRSKRAKVVHLSKVEKKGKEHSLKTFANVQAAADKYPYIYVFSVENMRNTLLKDVRTELADSRLFLGKTKVMAKALGDSEAEATQPGTHQLRPYMRGNIGLLCTARSPDEVKTFFENFRPMDYARAGNIASRDFTIPAGVVYSMAGEIPVEDDVPMAHSQEPNVRKLGVPTRLVKGKIELDSPHVVCRQGETLNSTQTTLLKMFGLATAEFAVELLAYWSKESGQVTEMQDEGGVKLNHGQMDMDEDDQDEEDEMDDA